VSAHPCRTSAQRDRGSAQRALYWYPSIAGWIRLGWDEIGHLYEDHVTAGLVVTCLSAHRAQPTVLPIRTNRRLLEFARERIAATRIVLTQLPIDGHELRVEARRRPGTDELRWFVNLGRDLDPKDPALSGKVDRALAELRATLGIYREGTEAHGQRSHEHSSPFTQARRTTLQRSAQARIGERLGER
jgi:hypothetical protein